jgi:hypothetical protein
MGEGKGVIVMLVVDLVIALCAVGFVLCAFCFLLFAFCIVP